MPDFRQRLESFLVEKNQPLNIQQLTPDASVREYFRVEWNRNPAIACVYPEPLAAAEQSYLDVTDLFTANNLPVAEIYDFDEQRAVIVLEDFGDTILRDVLLKSDAATRETLINQAIAMIAGIQAATANAFELNSIASRLKFDAEKLSWELNFFKTHYFESFRQTPLDDTENHALNAEFAELSAELETRAVVLCHRDFHAANLMIDRENRLRIIDHQDARLGSAAYDLVSLLLDRVNESPDDVWLNGKMRLLLRERERLSLKVLDFADFEHEFRLQTVQRCLKAVGTFSFQAVFRGKTHFVPFIEPALQIVRRICRRLDKFPNLQKIIQRQLNS